MARETITDFSGYIKGYIDTNDSTGDATATSFTGLILGYYFKSDNTTRDFHRKILSSGNTLAALIMNNNK